MLDGCSTVVLSGWDGIGWSSGGVRYRAPYDADNNFHGKKGLISIDSNTSVGACAGGRDRQVLEASMGGVWMREPGMGAGRWEQVVIWELRFALASRGRKARWRRSGSPQNGEMHARKSNHHWREIDLCLGVGGRCPANY